MDVSAGEKGKGPDKPLDPIVAVNSASEGSTGDEKTPIDEKVHSLLYKCTQRLAILIMERSIPMCRSDWRRMTELRRYSRSESYFVPCLMIKHNLHAGSHLNVTDSDLAEARSIAEGLSLEEVHKVECSSRATVRVSTS